MVLEDLLTLQATIFILILVGVCLKKFHIVGEAGKSVVTDLVINLILPANIIRSFEVEFDRKMAEALGTVLIISVVIQIGCTILGRILYKKKSIRQRQVLRYGILCSNAGFMGNPIAEGLFGSLGLIYASVYLIPQRIVMWSAGLSMFTDSPDRKTLMKKVLTHPCIIAVEIGVVIMVAGIKFPAWIDGPLSALSACNTALSMLIIGMVLADLNLKEMLDWDTVSYSILRLILMPAVVYVLCRMFIGDSVIVGVSTILAAMPAGATTVILASKYDGDEKFAAKIVVISTLFSIVSTLIWSILLVL